MSKPLLAPCFHRKHVAMLKQIAGTWELRYPKY